METAGASADENVFDPALLKEAANQQGVVVAQRRRRLAWLARHFSMSSQVRNLKAWPRGRG
jgi:hypothetical protein